MTQVEICVETVHGLTIAAAEGADRAELCSSLEVGGLTPPFSLMKAAARSGLAARPLLRPRSGSFIYDADESRLIADDIAAARDLGLDGVVIGAALEGGALDVQLLERLIDACGPIGRTLHRVFDLAPDPFAALESAILLGFDRILTSGQAPAAMDGAPLLRRLVQAAAGRITLVAASGVTAQTVTPLVRATGVLEVHASCRQSPAPAVDRPLDRFGFGAAPRPTDRLAVRSLVKAAAGAARPI